MDQTPVAGTAVRRQIPEVGAGWFNDHVRICAGGAGKPASLPRPHILHQLAITLNGGDLGAIENLASILRKEPATVAAWCAGSEPIPDGILTYILSAMGGTQASDATWRRDEWALAVGPPDTSDERRRHLFHLWPPRFRCRAVGVYIDTAAPFETEEPVDIETGVTYPDGHPFLLAEFEWIDPPPRPDHLVELLDAAVTAFQRLDPES